MKALLAALCLLIVLPALARADVVPPFDAQVPVAAADAGAQADDNKTGCSLMPGGPVKEVGALLFAGAFSLLFFMGRRKPNA